MQLNPSEISELIKSRIQNLGGTVEARTQGTVISVTDGICRVHGLADVMQGEMLEFPQQHLRPRAQPRARLGGRRWCSATTSTSPKATRQDDRAHSRSAGRAAS